MPKRSPPAAQRSPPAPGARAREDDADPDADGLVFEEPFEDEFEEEVVVESRDDGSDHQRDDEMEEEEEEKPSQAVYYVPANQSAQEEMEHDPSAYGLLHRMRLEWPALSFDFLIDQLGPDRTRYPATLYFVAGTQAETASGNAVNVVRLGQLGRTKTQEQIEDELTGAIDDDQGEDLDPTCEHRSQPHMGSVNRVRAMPQRPSIVATWSESGSVHLFDISRSLQTLNYPCEAAGAWTVSTLSGHSTEGFALDWSPVKQGRLATGDCAGQIIVWDASVGAANSTRLAGHAGSVEDLQWSPVEENVFASCSVDGTVKIWDTRSPKPMLSESAHEVDVNVISWNRKVPHLVASGSDDASFKVWDLRVFGKQQPVGWFHGFHQDAICSLEWSPHDESVLVAASSDHQVSIWDLALEEDREFARAAGDGVLAEDVLDANGRPVVIPPQLLFVHAGIQDPKEAHFHPQIVGLIGVTGEEGFDVFVCESLDPRGSALVN